MVVRLVRTLTCSALALCCSSERPSAAVPLAELLARTHSNPGAARARFVGHTIDTSGDVSAIEHDVAGALRVVLGDGPVRLKCYPPVSSTAAVVGRYPGDRVIIHGPVTDVGPDVYVAPCDIY